MIDLAPLIEDWPFPLFSLDDEDNILWINQAAMEWLGQSAQKLVGQHIWDVIVTDPDSRAITSKSRSQEATITIRHVSVKANKRSDESCNAHLTAYSTSAGIGFLVWFVGPQLRQNGLGGHVVSGMGRMIAHELKNPLAGIKGAAQLLREDIESEESLSLIELIGSEIDRIRRLADRMETLGNADPEAVKSVNVHEILRQARRVIQSASPHIIFEERYDPSLPHAYGDPDTLMQALLNLIVRNSRSSRQLPMQIRIIDDGPGIPQDMITQIFQPFVTTKSAGQGLGLAFVSKVAAAHQGIIEVQSVPGRTVFTILLPAPKNRLSEEVVT